MENKKLNAAQTPEETEQDISALSDRLEEMDKAEGVFGEVITDEELDFVVGGIIPTLEPLCSSSSGGSSSDHR